MLRRFPDRLTFVMECLYLQRWSLYWNIVQPSSQPLKMFAVGRYCSVNEWKIECKAMGELTFFTFHVLDLVLCSWFPGGERSSSVDLSELRQFQRHSRDSAPIRRKEEPPLPSPPNDTVGGPQTKLPILDRTPVNKSEKYTHLFQ